MSHLDTAYKLGAAQAMQDFQAEVEKLAAPPAPVTPPPGIRAPGGAVPPAAPPGPVNPGPNAGLAGPKRGF
jgi:hypothetical protein